MSSGETGDDASAGTNGDFDPSTGASGDFDPSAGASGEFDPSTEMPEGFDRGSAQFTHPDDIISSDTDVIPSDEAGDNESVL